MQDALVGLKGGRVPGPEAMGSFGEIQAAVGFPVRALCRGGRHAAGCARARARGLRLLNRQRAAACTACLLLHQLT